MDDVFEVALETIYGTLTVPVEANTNADVYEMFCMAQDKAEEAINSAKMAGIWRAKE